MGMGLPGPSGQWLCEVVPFPHVVVPGLAREAEPAWPLVGDLHVGVVRETADGPLSSCPCETQGPLLPIDQAVDIEAQLAIRTSPANAYGVGRGGVPQRPHCRGQEFQEGLRIRDRADVVGPDDELVRVAIDAL